MDFSISLSLSEEIWLRHVVDSCSREDTGTVVDCMEDRSRRIVSYFLDVKNTRLLSARALLSSVGGGDVVFSRPITIFTTPDAFTFFYLFIYIVGFCFVNETLHV